MKKLLNLVLFLSCITCLFSCSDNETVDEIVNNINIEDTLSGKSITRAPTSLSSYYGAYTLDPIYKASYYHINQYDTQGADPTIMSYPDYSNGWPNGLYNPQNCSWSNYIMAVGCVGRASGTILNSDYRINKARRLKKFMRNSRGDYDTASRIDYIYSDYGAVYDNPSTVGLRFWTTSKANNTTNHNIIALEILKHLYDFHTPIIFLGKKGSMGHYFTIVSVEWYGSLSNSKIWVADTTLGTTDDGFNASKLAGAIYWINFSTFLTNMSSCSDYSLCNMIFTYDLNA